MVETNLTTSQVEVEKSPASHSLWNKSARYLFYKLLSGYKESLFISYNISIDSLIILELAELTYAANTRRVICHNEREIACCLFYELPSGYKEALTISYHISIDSLIVLELAELTYGANTRRARSVTTSVKLLALCNDVGYKELVGS